MQYLQIKKNYLKRERVIDIYMDSFKIKYIINDNYKELINKKIYEIVLLKIISISNIVFPGVYEHIDEQSHGESDFIEIQNREFIDAKIIFPQKQCEYLSLDDLENFFRIICRETNDAFKSIMYDRESFNSTILYKEIVFTLKKIKKNENLIIFIPFPFTLEFENSISGKLGSDIFSQIIFDLREENSNFFKEHNVYIIYPNFENKIILKNLTTEEIEYQKNNIISDYIYVELSYI